MLKNLYASIKRNALEYYTLALLTVGLPLVAFVYFDWRAALATFVTVQTTLCVLYFVKGDD